MAIWKQRRPEGTPAARAAVLLPAAGRGRTDPVEGPPTDRVLGRGPAQGPRLRRPEGRAAAHRRAQSGRHPAGRDPASAAAGDARLVRDRAESRPRAAGLPPGLRHPGQHPVVPTGAARRGDDGRAAGADPGLQPVRGRAAPAGSADHADAGRRRRAGAEDAAGPASRDASRGRPFRRPGRRRRVDPGHPPSGAVPDRRRRPARDQRRGHGRERLVRAGLLDHPRHSRGGSACLRCRAGPRDRRHRDGSLGWSGAVVRLRRRRDVRDGRCRGRRHRLDQDRRLGDL